jgi:large subunit ribosomal protein L9
MSGTPMKLILTQEVSGLGAPGDVVEVAGGYGRNYLVPRGLAMRWTRGAEKQIDLIKRARSVREIRGVDDAREAASRLASLTVRLHTRAGGGGRLFGSVSPADIAAAVKAAGGPELDKRKIEIRNPIKTIGSHQVAVRLHPEVSATLNIEVAVAEA